MSESKTVTGSYSRSGKLKIRRALLSVADKTGIVELARALDKAGAEIVATGKTKAVLEEAGLKPISIEALTGNPEAFAGRMKSISFPVCSGILYRRGNSQDEADLKALGFKPIDCVVVNFYPFEETLQKGASDEELIEKIDIGGPTMVRSAAKNAPDTLVLIDPQQYASTIDQLEKSQAVDFETCRQMASHAWVRMAEYDQAIADYFSGTKLRYGENPHQKANLKIASDSPIAWPRDSMSALNGQELSYNNILDLSAAWELMSQLMAWVTDAKNGSGSSLGSGSGVVIVKHNNPCGVAWVEGDPSQSHSLSSAELQIQALERAWEGDPVSAFGGVVLFSHPIEENTAQWLADRFVELVAAPGLSADQPAFIRLIQKRKKLKAAAIRSWDWGSAGQGQDEARSIAGGTLIQERDRKIDSEFRCVTEMKWDPSWNRLAQFGVCVTRQLKSNAVGIFREWSVDRPGSQSPQKRGEKVFQLVGAGQGQPNRVEAIRDLALPRAKRVLGDLPLAHCILVSDAFFPFRDSVDLLADAGLDRIVQPGGSVKDAEVIAACNERSVSMVMTGVRHFKH